MKYELINPENLRKIAEKAQKSSLQWIASFNKKQSNRLDTQTHALHREIFEKIDCLNCANCCKSISPILYDRDIDRLAKALKMKSSEFIDQYLQIDEDQDFVFKNTPCPFLDGENYCLVYENRPKACREYPHTDRPRFYQILKLTVKNTFVCSAAYYVMEELKSNGNNPASL